jgi:hypothetical protein
MKRLLIVFSLASAVLVVLTASPAVAKPKQISCHSTPCTISASGGDTFGTTVAIVGDSITFVSSDYVERAFAHFSYNIDATSGYTMAQMYPAIQQLIPTSPRAWVVELGTNDLYTNSTAVGLADLTREVTTLATQRCVVLVSVNPRIDSSAVSIDQAMYLTVIGHSNFHVLDWGNIEWQNPTWVQPDGVHPLAKGSAELATLMKKSVDQFCRRGK